MNASACTLGTPDQRQRMVSGNGSSSTIESARIPHLAASRPPWSIGREMRKPNPISRSKKQLKLRQILSKHWGVAHKLRNIEQVALRNFGFWEFISNSFPVILGLVEELGPEDSIPYIEFLQNVFVRHSIILNLENSRLENRIYSAVRDFRQHKDSELFANSIKAGSPTDIQTRTAFETLSLSHNGSREIF